MRNIHLCTNQANVIMSIEFDSVIQWYLKINSCVCNQIPEVVKANNRKHVIHPHWSSVSFILFLIAQRLKENILLQWLLVSHIVVIISKRVWPMVCVLRLFLAFDAVEGVHVLLERLPCRALHLVDDYPTQLIYIWISIIQRRNIYVCFIRVICSSPCRWRRLCRQSEGWGGGRGYRSQRRDLDFFRGSEGLKGPAQFQTIWWPNDSQLKHLLMV